MLLAVVGVFGFCYSFEFIRRILSYVNYFEIPPNDYYDYAINHLADIFYVVNSSVNFIIYCLLGRKFRGEFLKILRKAGCLSQDEESKTRSSGSTSVQSTVSNVSSTSINTTDSFVTEGQLAS
jgi:hypothetical protein